MRPRLWLKIFYALLGFGSAANGMWMLAAPEHWFGLIPGAAHTGPLNLHLVRDFGACYLLVGLVILTALARNRLDLRLHGAVTLFFLFHAVIHVWDILSGRLGADHWTTDLPGVFLPVVLLLVGSLPAAWENQAQT